MQFIFMKKKKKKSPSRSQSISPTLNKGYTEMIIGEGHRRHQEEVVNGSH